MSHDNSHAAVNRIRLSIALGITVAVLGVEIVGAVVSGSLALLADAGHMLSDVFGLSIALVATIVAARPATDRQTFGYRRAEVFGALANGAILTAVSIYIVVEAVGRLVRPDEADVAGLPLLIVAGIGLLANLVAMFVLKAGAADSINMRGAYLEVLGDLLGSVAALIAGVVIVLTQFMPADAIASLFIAALIVPRAFLLLRDVFRVLSDSVPVGTSVAEIRTHILETPGVVGVHDVHVWAITSGSPVFTAHVIVERETFESGGTGPLLDRLGACLSEHFDVEHSTFQLEPAEHAAHEAGHHD